MNEIYVVKILQSPSPLEIKWWSPCFYGSLASHVKFDSTIGFLVEYKVLDPPCPMFEEYIHATSSPIVV